MSAILYWQHNSWFHLGIAQVAQVNRTRLTILLKTHQTVVSRVLLQISTSSATNKTASYAAPTGKSFWNYKRKRDRTLLRSLNKTRFKFLSGSLRPTIKYYHVWNFLHVTSCGYKACQTIQPCLLGRWFPWHGFQILMNLQTVRLGGHAWGFGSSCHQESF